MKPIRLSACGWLAAALLGACAGGAHYSAGVAVTTPDLVEVDPGVEVVADANEPLFFADGYYWLYRDGAWLRSDNYRGGFARVDIGIVPQHIRSIQRPKEYVHFNRTERGRELARGGQYPMRDDNPEARQLGREGVRPMDAPQQPRDTNRHDPEYNEPDNPEINREDMNRAENTGQLNQRNDDVQRQEQEPGEIDRQRKESQQKHNAQEPKVKHPDND